MVLKRASIALLCGLLSACGAALAPPATGQLGAAASRAFQGGTELVVSRISERAWQANAHIHVATDTVADVHLFLNDMPGAEYGWLMAGGGLRRRFGQTGDAVRMTMGFGVAMGAGGRWPAYREGDVRYPRATAAYIDVGAVIGTPWDWLTLFAEGRVQRAWAGGGREAHRPPTTDWALVGCGLRADHGRLFGSLHLGSATFTNYHSDGDVAVAGLSIGYHFMGTAGAPLAAR